MSVLIMRAFPSLRSAGPALALSLSAAALGACSADRTITNTVAMTDSRVRHPVVLTNAEKTLDIFPTGNGLDSAARARIAEFAAQYRDNGEGRLTVLMPRGSATDMLADQQLPAVRQALGPRVSVGVGTYPVYDPHLAAPIRISGIVLKAKVATRCGEWPQDLAGGGSTQGWSNTPYWNFGCATQSNFAAQVADPRDLANPRAEQPADVAMRMRAIGKVRQGVDPGTEWRVKNSEIGAVGTGQ